MDSMLVLVSELFLEHTMWSLYQNTNQACLKVFCLTHLTFFCHKTSSVRKLCADLLCGIAPYLLAN